MSVGDEDVVGFVGVYEVLREQELQPPLRVQPDADHVLKTEKESFQELCLFFATF